MNPDDHPRPERPADRGPIWAGPPEPPAARYGAYPPPQPVQPGPPAERPRMPWGRMVAVAAIVGLVAGGAGAAVTYVALDEPAGPAVTAPVPDQDVAGGESVNPVVDVASAVLPGVVSIDIRSTSSQVTGSGFVYDRAGHVVTNNHVVANAPDGSIRVVLADGTPRQARIVGTSPSYDLAVLQVRGDTGGLSPLTLGHSDDVQVGQSVVSVGSPLGLEATVTSGIISALDRPVTAGSVSAASYIDALQTDASINPGNSGGPLVDLNGRVIGVNSAIATVGGTTQGQAGSVGLGFSIPIDQVRRTVAQILQTGEARYPVIGANVSVERSTGGAVVTGVSPGSPAEQTDLQRGDRIVQVNGTPVSDGVELIVEIRSFTPGDEISLTYLRGGARETTRVTLAGQVG